ncbi:MAG TPA: carbohydrate kinase [Planktothrix sp.]
MVDVLCLGEILVDWVCTTAGDELDRAQSFTKAAGGAPANTAVGLARQGVPTGFVGCVADDEFGRWLKAVLEDDGIDTSNVVVDAKAQTRMAYVVTTKTGDRKLAEFTKIACADARLKPEDLRTDLFSDATALHFGSISLIADPAAGATKRAVALARKHNMFVSYDPNVRLGLWPSPEICKQTILDTLKWADLVKINEDELHTLTGSRHLSAADRLREEHGVAIFIVTLDSRGAYLSTAKGNKTVPGFQVQLVEATGAGDGFNSGMIAGLIPFIKGESNRRRALLDMDMARLAEIVRRANAIGAITCTRAGAIPALPKHDEIETFLKQMSAQTSS